jgi:3-isopropylmalate/(R)-2-methylmalate dehydratase small subunit
VAQALFERVAENPGYQLTIDLQNQEIKDDLGLSVAFEIDPFRKECLLSGLDDIGMTLKHEDKIAAFEATRNGA